MIRFALLSAIFVTGLFCKAQDLPYTRSKLQDHPTETGSPGPRTGSSASRCHYVSLDSDDEAITSEQLRQAVGLEPEFARQGFALSTGLQLADVRVHLGIISSVVQDRTSFLQAWDTRSHTTTQENFPWPRSDHEHVIATRVIVMLSKLCGEPWTAKVYQDFSHEQIAERLGSFHLVQAISRTYLASKRMVIELSAREEMTEWGITISPFPDSAEVVLIIDHLPSISWEYRLVDLKHGVLLDSGTVFAFQEERAASRIADTLIIHLAAYRPLKRVRTTPANSSATSPSSEQFGSWGVTEIHETFEGPEPMSQEIRLTLQTGKLIGSTSNGQTEFSIGINRIVDVAFDDSAYISLADPRDISGGDEGLGLTILAAELLHQIKITKYRIHIAWNEGNTPRIVSLQASQGKLRELFAMLAAVVNAKGVLSDIR